MRMDHVAHPCRDPHQTYRFYSGVLGFSLVQAYSGRNLMLVFEAPGGGSFVFTTSQDRVSVPVENASWERQHVGLTVADCKEFDSWLARLTQFGISYQLINDERIYFTDPNGLVLEIEVAEPSAPNPAASDVLARWRP